MMLSYFCIGGNTNMWISLERCKSIMIATLSAIGVQQLTQKLLGDWSWGAFGATYVSVSEYLSSKENSKERLEKKANGEKTHSISSQSIAYRVDHVERLKAETPSQSHSIQI